MFIRHVNEQATNNNNPPLIFYIRYLPDPTPGAPPTCPSRFHRTPIHTILDERLVIFEVFPDTKPSILWV